MNSFQAVSHRCACLEFRVGVAVLADLRDLQCQSWARGRYSFCVCGVLLGGLGGTYCGTEALTGFLGTCPWGSLLGVAVRLQDWVTQRKGSEGKMEISLGSGSEEHQRVRENG